MPASRERLPSVSQPRYFALAVEPKLTEPMSTTSLPSVRRSGSVRRLSLGRPKWVTTAACAVVGPRLVLDEALDETTDVSAQLVFGEVFGAHPTHVGGVSGYAQRLPRT